MDIMASKNIYYFCWALSKGRSKGIQWKITIAWMRHERSFRSTVLTNVFAPWMILLYRGGRAPRCWSFEDFFLLLRLHLDAIHVNRILKDVESFVDFSIVKYEKTKFSYGLMAIMLLSGCRPFLWQFLKVSIYQSSWCLHFQKLAICEYIKVLFIGRSCGIRKSNCSSLIDLLFFLLWVVHGSWSTRSR